MPLEGEMSEKSRSGKDAGGAGQEPKSKAPRGSYGRRSVLAGAAAASAGAVAGLAGGTGVAQAGSGPVELGQVNHASATTLVIASSGTGLAGQTSTKNASGVAGIDNGSTATGHGTYGRSANGNGVYGTSTLGNGVYGSSTAGAGVFAATDTGFGLVVLGRAMFSNSGVATVKKGRATVTVTVTAPDVVGPNSIILATIQTPQKGVYIEGAVPGSFKITITLNKAATADMRVGWFALAGHG
jgi:hypothetical protein